MNISYNDAVLLVKKMLEVHKETAAHMGASFALAFASIDPAFDQMKFRGACIEPPTDDEINRAVEMEKNVEANMQREIDSGHVDMPSLEEVEEMLRTIGAGGKPTLH